MVPAVAFNDGVHAAKMLFDKLWVNIPECQVWLDGISAWRWKWDTRLGIFTRDEVHDSASHKGSVLRYAGLSEKDMTNDIVVVRQAHRGKPKPYQPEYGEYGG